MADEAAGASKVSRKMNKATVGQDSRAAARVAAKADRHRARQTDARAADADDAHVEIDPTAVLSAGQTPAAPQLVGPPLSSARAHAGKNKKSAASARSTLVEAGADSSDEEDNQAQIDAQRGRGPAAFQQRELVAQAFAGDNVVAVRGLFLASELPGQG